ALLVGLWGAFATSAVRRFRLLRTGSSTWEPRFDRLGERLLAVVRFALLQSKMPNYLLAGVAHYLIFSGFVVLLLRTLVLWGRGFDPTFNLFVLGPEPVLGLPLGELYGFAKDVFGLLVIAGALTFVYLRVVRREKRMTLSGEGLVILGIIATMMLADLSYDGASLLLHARAAAECGTASYCAAVRELTAPLGPPRSEFALELFPEPGGMLFATLLGGLGSETLVPLAKAGFWTHSTLVLVFLN